MTPDPIIAIISGIVAIIVPLISKTELFARKHYGLKKDVELYASLPNISTEKAALLIFIDKSINEYIKQSTQHRRNGSEIAVGVIFIPIGIYLTWFFVSLGSWWLLGVIVSIFILLIGLVGIFNGLQKTERDEKGNAMPEKK